MATTSKMGETKLLRNKNKLSEFSLDLNIDAKVVPSRTRRHARERSDWEVILKTS